MKALVIGAGGVGRAIANIASRRSFITEMVIADRNLSRAEEAVTRLKDPRFSAAMVNAAELEDIRELIRKADPDVVINAVDPRFVMPIFLACEIEKRNYMDMAMSLSRPIRITQVPKLVLSTATNNLHVTGTGASAEFMHSSEWVLNQA